MLAVLAVLGPQRACARLRAAARGGRFATSLDDACARRSGGVRPGAVLEGAKEVRMLRIYDVLLQVVCEVRPLIGELERKDPDLARQCRRALMSAPLNVAEGSYSRGKNRVARYHTALGSLCEVMACFEVAVAFGYMSELDPGICDRMDQCIGTLVRLVGY